jgi:hypothetical protein
MTSVGLLNKQSNQPTVADWFAAENKLRKDATERKLVELLLCLNLSSIFRW